RARFRRTRPVNVTHRRYAERFTLPVWQGARDAYADVAMPPTPLPSATVVIMRDGASGVETLMVQRNVELSFHGGSWVFPGGRIDPIDRMRARTDDVVEAARQAAIREAEEEAGVRLEANGLSV